LFHVLAAPYSCGPKTNPEGSMAELKTQKNKASVKAFLDGVADERKRRDAKAVLALMQAITKEKPAMWGPSIVGFGSYNYKQRSGQAAQWPLTGFSPRKDSLTLYIMPGFEKYSELLGKLGKHKTGVSCLYIKSLDDVHVPTLKTLVRESVKHMKQIAKERA
jgi:hypothetical protein